MNFGGLPDELVYQTLSYTDPASLASFGRVSRGLVSISRDERLLQDVFRTYNRNRSGDPKEYDRYTSGEQRDHVKDFKNETFKGAFDDNYREALESISAIETSKDFGISSNLKLLPREIGRLARLLHTLRLDRNRLRELPEEFGLLKITRLDLSHNLFTSVPNEIGRLKMLEVLDLRHNKLAHVSVVGMIPSLRQLLLNHNRITSVDEGIAKLKQLELLDLSNNDMTEMPLRVYRFDTQRDLTLRLKENRLENLPEDIGDLVQLETLDLSSNRLTSLPYRIGNLSMLRELIAVHNRLERLPGSIGKLGRLDVMLLSGNELTGLPKELGRLRRLGELNVSQNSLTSLPVEIASISGLRRLNVNDNRISHIPDEIVDLVRSQHLYLSFKGNPAPRLSQEIAAINDANFFR